VNDEQSQKPFKRIKIAIVVEKRVSVEEAERSDQTVHCLAHRVPSSPELAAIRSRGCRQILSTHRENLELLELPMHLLCLCLPSHALQDLAQNDVCKSEPLPLQVCVQPFRVGRVYALEVIDPDRRIDKNHN